MGTPVTVKQPHRLTPAEALTPIENVTCGKCGEAIATLFPVPDTGMVACPVCSPSWLLAWLRDWSAREQAKVAS